MPAERIEVVGLLLSRMSQVLFADDVVALEYASGLVAGNRHGHSLGDAGANHVANRTAPEIMEQSFADLGILACGLPCLNKLLDSVGSLGIQKYEW